MTTMVAFWFHARNDLTNVQMYQGGVSTLSTNVRRRSRELVSGNDFRHKVKAMHDVIQSVVRHNKICVIPWCNPLLECLRSDLANFTHSTFHRI